MIGRDAGEAVANAEGEGERPDRTSETLIERERPAAPPPAPSGATRSFGDYEILGEIARGAMGVVLRARHTRLGREVALKRIMAGEFASDDDVGRFLSEARAAANLRHPGIVTIYDVGERDGQHFFSMELIEGESLEARLRRGPMTPTESAGIVLRVAEAMAVAHAGGVVHRDLKPANVLLDADGHPKVTDFGLAKSLHETDGRTAAGAVMGTPQYMAPEQAGGRTAEVGPAADIYAMGGILYTLLTGRPTFPTAPLLETLRHVIEDEPRPPRQIDPAIPIDLERVVNRCLRKDPKRRYGSASELAADLGRWLAGERVLTRNTSMIGRTTAQVRRRLRPVDLVISGLAAAACLAVVYWAVYLRVDPYARLRREEIDRVVWRYRSHPMAAISKPHPSRRTVPTLAPPDPSAFETIERFQTYDFQAWRDGLPDPGKGPASPVSVATYRRVRKIKPVAEYRHEAKTSGFDVYSVCDSHPNRFHEDAEAVDGLIGGQRMKSRQLVIDVADVEVDSEFEIDTRGTFWDAFQRDDQRWVGVLVRDRPIKVSFLVIFPTNRPLKSYQLRVAEVDGKRVRAYDGEQFVIEGRDNGYLFWEVISPLPQQVYRIDWKW